MAQKQDHLTEINGRVRIKDSVTHMYKHARVYNEAWVRAQAHDEYGYPTIFVEWDRDHWAYSGEENRWVLEAHFDPVEEDKMADDKFNNLLKGLADLVASYNDDETPDAPEDKRPKDDEDLSYEQILKLGFEDALKGEAFLLFVASNQEFQGRQAVVPLLYVQSKHDDAQLLLETAIADHVSRTVGRLVQENSQARRDGSSGS